MYRLATSRALPTARGTVSPSTVRSARYRAPAACRMVATLGQRFALASFPPLFVVLTAQKADARHAWRAARRSLLDSTDSLTRKLSTAHAQDGTRCCPIFAQPRTRPAVAHARHFPSKRRLQRTNITARASASAFCRPSILAISSTDVELRARRCMRLYRIDAAYRCCKTSDHLSTVNIAVPQLASPQRYRGIP